jgi:hypothetical protein
MLRTNIRLQAPRILQVQIRQGSVDVRAHLLARLSRAKGPDHGDLRRTVALLRAGIAAQDRIEVGRGGLVVVDAVQAEAERVHDDAALASWVGGQSQSNIVAASRIQDRGGARGAAANPRT